MQSSLEEATVPVSLIEANEPVECNVVFRHYDNGSIVILHVQKPVQKDPLTYADISLSKEALATIEDWLHDNWATY